MDDPMATDENYENYLKTPEATTHAYLRGYWQCLWDFGIWKDGVQHIGCLDEPIKQCLKIKCQELGVDYEWFMNSVGEKL